MLTSSTLRSNIDTVRQEAAKFMLDQCVIRRWIGATVTDGIAEDLYQDVVSVCRWNPRFGFETRRGWTKEEQSLDITTTGVYRLQLPYDQEVSERDFILFGGKVFDIVWVPVKHEFTGALIIEVREIK